MPTAPAVTPGLTGRERTLSHWSLNGQEYHDMTNRLALPSTNKSNPTTHKNNPVPGRGSLFPCSWCCSWWWCCLQRWDKNTSSLLQEAHWHWLSLRPWPELAGSGQVIQLSLPGAKHQPAGSQDRQSCHRSEHPSLDSPRGGIKFLPAAGSG